MAENDETVPVNETPGFIKDIFDNGTQLVCSVTNDITAGLIKTCCVIIKSSQVKSMLLTNAGSSEPLCPYR